MSWIKRIGIPLWIAAIVFAISFSEYYLNIPVLSDAVQLFSISSTMILAFSIILGSVVFTRYHVNKTIKREGRWTLSVYILAVFIVQTFFGIEPWLRTGNPGDLGTGSSFKWLFTSIQAPLDITLSSIYVLFVAYGIFKAIRIKSNESWFFIIPMFLVMLTNAPIGEALFPQVPAFGRWFMDNIMVGGLRGINIAVAFGLMFLGLRILLRREQTAVGGSIT